MNTKNPVVHCKVAKYDVYVGRPSKWSNPFNIGRDGSRQEVIEKYKTWLLMGDGQYLLPQLKELKGKVLGCYCKPNKCHADILAELSNGARL